jgi:hypothetical protein
MNPGDAAHAWRLRVALGGRSEIGSVELVAQNATREALWIAGGLVAIGLLAGYIEARATRPSP